MIRQATRAAVILWTFTRRGLLWSVYSDVVRGHVSNPHCACEDDLGVAKRARRLRTALEQLGPTFVKLGQFLSRRPDLAPPGYLKELAELQEGALAVPFSVVRRRLEEVCICSPSRSGEHVMKPACLHCRHIEGVFEEFDPDPVASASVAQVHRAVYRGEQVAVKLLKPGVLDRLNADFALLERLRWFVGRVLGVSRNMPVDDFLREFRRTLLEEVNLEYEAINIERFRDRHPDDGPVRAPAVFWEFERADILVLEFITGVSLREWRGTEDEGRRLAEVLAEDFIRQVFVDNFFHADPHPGNVFIQPDGRVAYLDFGTVGRLDRAARRALLMLLRAILEDDSELACRAVLEAGRTDPRSVDMEELRSSVDRIIQLYRRRGGARWTDAVVLTARRHRLQLPRSFLRYAKATMLNESLVTELDPGFVVLPVARRMARPIIEKELTGTAERLKHGVPELVDLLEEILEDLPRIIRRRMDSDATPA